LLRLDWWAVAVTENQLHDIVEFLTTFGDRWGMNKHPIYLLRDGIPPGLTAPELRVRNSRITVILTIMMEISGRLVDDAMIDDVIEFVEDSRDNDDFND
jgi:hypothetical protein